VKRVKGHLAHDGDAVYGLQVRNGRAEPRWVLLGEHDGHPEETCSVGKPTRRRDRSRGTLDGGHQPGLKVDQQECGGVGNKDGHLLLSLR